MKYNPNEDKDFQQDKLLNDGLDIQDNFRKPAELGYDTLFNQIAYSWPAADAVGRLTSDGDGGLIWVPQSAFLNAIQDGIPSGNMYLHEATETITIAANDTYYHITGLETGELVNGVTVLNHSLYVPIPGIYKVDWNVAGESVSNNEEYEFDVFVGITEQYSGSGINEFGALAAKGSTSGHGLVRVADISNGIDLHIKQTSAGTDNFTINMANITIQLNGLIT